MITSEDSTMAPEPARCGGRTVLFIATFLFRFALVFCGDCDFTVITGNVTYSQKLAVISISEKENPDGLCLLEDKGAPKITCDLSSLYFDCSENRFQDGNTGLNISLIASVDDAVDKPTNTLNWYGAIGCSNKISLNNLETTTNGILINVNLVNDHTPSISSGSLEIADLPETFPFGDHRFELASIYGLKITATDGDTAGDSTSRVQFAITHGDDVSMFSISTIAINQNTNAEYFVAQLYLEKQLDYSKQANFNLTITAKDEGSPSLESSVILFIDVKPENTLGPVFDYDFYRANINQSVIDGRKHELSMQPEDIDAGDAANRPIFNYRGHDVIYSLLIDNCGTSCDAITASFTLDQSSAKITFDSSAPFHLIDNNVAIFGVKATWNDDYKRSSTAIVTITLPMLISTTAATQTTTVAVTTNATSTPPPTQTTSQGSTTVTPPPTQTSTSRTTTAPVPTTSCPTCPPCHTTTHLTTTESQSTAHTTTSKSPSTAQTNATSSSSSSSSSSTERTTVASPPSTETTTTSPCQCPTTTTECPATVTPSPHTSASSHRPWSSTTPEMPIPVPNLEFYESVKVPVTTLITAVIFTIRFHDDANKTYDYSAADCDGYDLSFNYFIVDKTSGNVAVKQPLIVHEFCLNFTAISASGEPNYKAVVIDVFNGTLEETLPEDYYEVHINESKDDTATLLVDLDSFYEEKQLAVYTLKTWVEAGFFFLNSVTGELFAIKGLDHERHPVYQLIISVSWRKTALLGHDGNPVDLPYAQFGNLSHNEVLVRVVVDDVNDHAPQFDVGLQYAIGIASYVGEGQTVMTLTATDADDTEDFKRIYYSISDTTVPFFVNQNSGLVRAKPSMQVLQTSGAAQYDFQITAANSADGLDMPSQLHLTVYILTSEEILVISTRKSGLDFDDISAQIIEIFKEKLNVDVRIIQWETDADGNTVAYMYMLPLHNNKTSLRTKRFATSNGGPLQKEFMLSLIKENAELLEAYFAPDTAKTYDELPQPKPDTSGLIAAVVVLAVILGLIIIAGAVIMGYFYRRKFTKGKLSYINRSRTIETNHRPSFSNSLYATTQITPDVFEGNNKMADATKSLENRSSCYAESSSENSSESDLSETIQGPDQSEEKPAQPEPEIIDNTVMVLTAVANNAPEIDYKEPDPELDYLKSILVDPEKVAKIQKPFVKFADDVTSDNESTDDVRL